MNEPERLYLDTEVVHPAGRRNVSICRTSDTDIEYTRTDAFIEKACDYINCNLALLDAENNNCMPEWLENFKKAMKL